MRQRTPKWKAPDGAVYVGRPGQWGNPFVVGERYSQYVRGQSVRVEHVTGMCKTAETAVRLFRRWIAMRADYAERVRVELAGRDLMCWCPLDKPCHADVLLEVANPEIEVLHGRWAWFRVDPVSLDGIKTPSRRAIMHLQLVGRWEAADVAFYVAPTDYRGISDEILVDPHYPISTGRHAAWPTLSRLWGRPVEPMYVIAPGNAVAIANEERHD